MLDGLSPTAGGGIGKVPVPLRATVSGLFAALLGTTRFAERGPRALGAKLRLTVQLALAPRLVFEQPSTRLKSGALKPWIASWPICKSPAPAPPLLVIVSCCEPLIEPTGTAPKLRLEGVSPTWGGGEADGSVYVIVT